MNLTNQNQQSQVIEISRLQACALITSIYDGLQHSTQNNNPNMKDTIEKLKQLGEFFGIYNLDSDKRIQTQNSIISNNIQQTFQGNINYGEVNNRTQQPYEEQKKFCEEEAQYMLQILSQKNVIQMFFKAIKNSDWQTVNNLQKNISQQEMDFQLKKETKNTDTILEILQQFISRFYQPDAKQQIKSWFGRNKYNIQDILQKQDYKIYLMQSYMNKDFEVINKELKHSRGDFDSLDLDFINLQQRCYILSNYRGFQTCPLTLYEYCILLKKYKYIKKYCQFKLKYNCVYSTDKFFDYCFSGNVEGVYYCIMEGVNPNKKYKNKLNAYIIACKRQHKELLCMMLENFKINTNLKYRQNYKSCLGYDDEDYYRNRCIRDCSGFIYSCMNNDAQIAGLLFDLCPQVIYNRAYSRDTGFMFACDYHNKKTVDILLNKYPQFLFQSGKLKETSFLKACKYQYFLVIRLLNRCPKIIYQINRSNKTGFMIACEKGDMDTIYYLVKCFHNIQDQQFIETIRMGYQILPEFKRQMVYQYIIERNINVIRPQI